MTAAFFRNVQDLVWQVSRDCPFYRRCRFQQLILVVRSMRIVALQAIANRRRMNGALDLGGILVGVAGETEPVGSGRDQLHAGHVLVHPNLVTTQAAHRDGGMDEFAFRLILVAFQALAASIFGSSGTG